MNNLTHMQGTTAGKTKTVYVQTAQGKKLAFSTLRYTNQSQQAGTQTKLVTNNEIAVRAVNTAYVHTVVHGNQLVKSKEKPVLVAHYQCFNTEVQPTIWQHIMTAIRVDLS